MKYEPECHIMLCDACHEGKVDCPECLEWIPDDQSIECLACDSTGLIECATCGGSGESEL